MLNEGQAFIGAHGPTNASSTSTPDFRVSGRTHKPLTIFKYKIYLVLLKFVGYMCVQVC